MISIQNVNKWYGDFQVLSDCSTEKACFAIEKD